MAVADNDDDDACMHAERGRMRGEERTRVAIVNKRESYYDKRKCSTVIVSTTSHNVSDNYQNQGRTKIHPLLTAATRNSEPKRETKNNYKWYLRENKQKTEYSNPNPNIVPLKAQSM